MLRLLKSLENRLNFISKSKNQLINQNDYLLALALTIPIFIFILTSCYWRWFNPGFSVYGDWIYIPNTKLAESSFTAFSSALGMPQYTTIYQANLQPLWVLHKFLWKTFFFDFGIIEKIIYFSPFIFLVIFSPFYLAQKLFNNPLISIFTSILYSLNTYVFVLMSEAGHINTGLAYSIAPLTLAFFISLLKEQKWSTAILSGLILSIETIFDIRLSYITIFLIIFAYIFLLIKRKNISNTRTFKFNSIIKLLLPFVVTFLIHSYWILWVIPTFIMNNLNITPHNAYEWVHYLSFQSISNALTTFHPFWGERIQYFTKQPISILFYFFPFFFFFPLLINRKDKYILYFTLISIFSAFLVKGSEKPFAIIYTWLFEYFPGFSMFRESQKFFAPLMLANSVLFGISIGLIYQLINKIRFKMKKLISCLFLLITLLGVFYSVKPAITQKIQGTFNTESLPINYVLLEEYLENDKEFSRVLWLPYLQKFSYYSEIHPAVFYNNFQNDIFSWLQQNKEDINIFFDKPYIKDLLSITSIKYIIVPDERDQNIYKLFGKSKETYINIVENIKDLKRINISNDIYLWENKDYLPRLFSSPKINIYKDYNGLIKGINNSQANVIKQPFMFLSELQKRKMQNLQNFQASPNIEVIQVDSTKFKIKIIDAKTPYYLIFLEPFDSLWKIYINQTKNNVLSSFSLNNNFLQENNHYKVYEYANAWMIDKTGTYELILEYYPQRLMKVGLIISLISLVTFISLFAFFKYKEKKYMFSTTLLQ
jgi:hypothetical protein